MCKNMTNTRQKESSSLTGCEIVDKVRYLGVNLTMKNIDFFKNNYVKLNSNRHEEVEQIKYLIHGNIAVIKMNVLPRIMFLFRTIPII